MALSLATMKDNRVNCWEPQTRNGVGNQQPSLKRKAIAPGLRKVQRLGGEETITRPRVPDYPRGRRYSLTLRGQPQEANHKQVCDNNVMLKTVMQGAWTEGGSPNYLLVGPHVKTVVSGFAGIAEQRYMAPSDGPTTIIGAADVYVSDFGAISIVPSRFSRARDAYLIDKELVTLATLRPMQSQELAKTGKSCPLLAKALQDNSVNCLGTPNVKSRAISSEASFEERSTTIPSGSTAKRLEVQSTLLGEDIVSSLQKCKAALKECGNSLANCFEDLFSCFTRKLTDATRFMLLVEYGLQVNNEKGLGAVYDLSTS